MKHLKKMIYVVKRFFFTYLAKRNIKSYGVDLCVNGYSKLGRNTSVGNYCNFNGMKCLGGGQNSDWKLLPFWY